MAIVVALRLAIDVSYLQIYEIAFVKVPAPLPRPLSLLLPRRRLPLSLSLVLHKIELCALGF